MNNIVKEILNQIRNDKEKRRKTRAVLLMLSLLVSSGVLWQLKITGITMTGEALCGQLEHQHSEQCLGVTLVCGQEESEGHTHDSSACYRALSCEQEHTHEDACYVLSETPTCGLEESEGHSHVDACRLEAYTCGYATEHTHGLLCYSDANADLETSSDWEKTIPALGNTDAEDLAAVARSQIGYTESQQNYKVAEDGVTKQGYSRYGEWYGNPYGNWNAMFVSFCLHYAEHPAYEALKNSGAETMRLAAEQAGVYQSASSMVPCAGDLVFLDKDSNGICETVAVVVGNQDGSMTVVEGDCGGAVAENRYSLDNGTILGYALLTPRVETAAEPAGDPVDETAESGAYNLTKSGEVEAQADGNITVSFVINNAAYMSDSGSGETHLTVNLTEKNNPAGDGYSADGGLTYTYWTKESGKYKHKITSTTGTGTLMTCSIPAGTTLAGSGYSLPGIGVTNITGSTESYLFARSWVTDSGMICNDDTVFTEDTTLYLSLYPSGESYSLNWVCNCTSEGGGSHSVYFNLTSLYPSPTFALGQSLAPNYILSAADVNSTYTGTDSCNVGSGHNMEFTGWYLKNETTGEETEFAAGVPFLAEHVDPNAEYTVKVYARWEETEAPTEVTATFVNGDTTTTVPLASGSALGDNLPTVTAPDGQVFLGWQIGSTTEYATAETVIDADTTYTAVFADKVTATFVNGETTVETRELAAGAALGTLPAGPAADGQTFLGWKAEGADSYATAETVITADTTYTAVFTQNVTATFMHNNTEFAVVANIPVNAKLWDYLPEEVPEDYTDTDGVKWTFAGWQITGGQIVTETTLVPSDLTDGKLTLTSVFEEFAGCSVYFHDIDPDGNPYGAEGETLDILIPEGESVADYLDGLGLLHDDADPADCIWKYKVGEEQKLTDYDLEALVTSELHLYTYTYRITLSRTEEAAAAFNLLDLLAVQASAVEVTVDDNGILTLVLRDGEKPTAADFVVNGVDYTLYTWTYEDADGNDVTLNISDIIAKGVSANITATSTGAMNDKLTQSSMNIHFFVCIDGQWTEIKNAQGMNVYTIDEDRYYLTPAQLETVYGEYGFNADTFTETDYFFLHEWHSDSGVTNIWTATQAITTRNGAVLVPLTRSTGDVDVYYLPGNTTAYNNGKTVASLGDDYSFYSVTVHDATKLIYDDAADIPPVSYVFTGVSASVTLKNPSADNGAYWLVNGEELKAGDGITAVDNGDGTTTYTFANVTEPIRISAYIDNLFEVSYDINLTDYTPVSTRPTVNGAATYIDSVQVKEDGTYVVLTPSRTQFSIAGSNAYQTVVFTGWQIEGTNTILDAGTVLTAAELKTYGSTLSLVAQWENMEYSNSVSFYINLELEVLNYAGSVNDTPNSDFTGVLYGTKITIDPDPAYYDNDVVLEANAQSDTAAIDAKIRSLVDGVTTEYMNEQRTLTLSTFPNDEKMLARVRAAQAEYIASFEKSTYYNASDPTNVTAYRAVTATDSNGKEYPVYRIICEADANDQLHYIPVDELTSENYTIRWYVLKKEGSNGWHIDGVLVKKQAQMTITKTFAGDAAAITEVKKNFAIDVKGVKETSSNQDFLYTLTLNAEADQTDNTATVQTEQGYKTYDQATNTYTWVINLTADWLAYVHERNYVRDDAAIATLAEYTASNFTVASMNTTGKVTYTQDVHDNGVEVVAKAHNVDEDHTNYETVAFTNTYIPTAAVPISKVDDYGNPLTGVSFSLYKNGVKCSIYIDENTGTYYIYEPTGTTVTPVTSGLITVDSHGYAMVMGLKEVDENGNYSDYTFKLEETVAPEGYTPIEDIEFTIGENGEILLKGTTSSATLLNGDVIRVTNASKNMDITVVKQWLGDTTEEVQAQLTQNGNPLSGKTATLNAANNWTYTWDDLPIYVGGKLAEYSIRENWIGNTAYNGAYPDGYENYIVTVSKPVTVDENDDGMPDSATITVTNQIYEGGLKFAKVDEMGNGLAGATFQLFTDEACQNAYGYGAISDLYGNVDFGYLTAGTYYMMEVKPPAGYQANNTVYKVVVSGTGTVITDNADTTGTPINSVENVPATATLKVQKVDGDNNALSGAAFEVHMLNTATGKYEKISKEINNELMTKFAVDENGQLTVEELMPGDYKLVEVQAPAGYYRMTEEIYFNVAPSAIVARDVTTNENGETIIDTTNSWSFDGETITVVNVTGSELPQTGGMGTHFGTMAGLLMMAGSLLYGFLLRRKRERGAV